MALQAPVVSMALHRATSGRHRGAAAWWHGHMPLLGKSASMRGKQHRHLQPSTRTAASHSNAAVEGGTAHGQDPLRDSALRYLGYANEVGEAFGPLVPGAVVVASYVVAISYVLVDVVDKFSKARASALKALLPPAVNPGGADRSSHTSRGVPSASGATLEQELQSRRKTAEGAATRIGMLRALDVLAWQGIASIVVPGYTIHCIVHALAECLAPGGAAAAGLAATLAALAHAAGRAPSTAGSFASALLTCIPTAVGLLLIPFIAPPIDHTTEHLLDVVLRPWLRKQEEQVMESARSGLGGQGGEGLPGGAGVA